MNAVILHKEREVKSKEEGDEDARRSVSLFVVYILPSHEDKMQNAAKVKFNVSLWSPG